jgi:hypothetical protein
VRGANPGVDLRGVIRNSIQACADLLLEGPANLPKFKSNFGLSALEKWARLVVDAKDKKGWAKVFPRGGTLYSALLMGYEQIELWGTGGSASRPMYAAFLEEAAPVVDAPGLMEAAARFRQSGKLWSELASAMLPDNVPQLRQAGELTLEKHRQFIEGGMETIVEREKLEARLAALKADATADFPLSESEVAALREDLRERVLKVHDTEGEAALALRSAIV